MRQRLTSLKIFAKRIGSQWTMHCLYMKSSRTNSCIASLRTWLMKWRGTSIAIACSNTIIKRQKKVQIRDTKMSNIVNARINARIQFLTRDGDANTNKGAVVCTLFWFFYSNFGPKITLSLLLASTKCNSEQERVWQKKHRSNVRSPPTDLPMWTGSHWGRTNDFSPPFSNREPVHKEIDAFKRICYKYVLNNIAGQRSEGLQESSIFAFRKRGPT